MGSSIACCSRGMVLPTRASSHRSTALVFSIVHQHCQELKNQLIFGESLRSTVRSYLKLQKAKNSSSLVTRSEIGDSLEEFLTKATEDKALIILMMCMGEVIRTIGYKVRTASCGPTACVNTFGDEQLAVCMLANKLLFEASTYSHFCKYACSEEVPEL